MGFPCDYTPASTSSSSHSPSLKRNGFPNGLDQQIPCKRRRLYGKQPASNLYYAKGKSNGGSSHVICLEVPPSKRARGSFGVVGVPVVPPPPSSSSSGLVGAGVPVLVPPPPPPSPSPLVGWGQIASLWQGLPPAHLQCSGEWICFGNVRIHYSHLLTLHHINGESLLYCPTCMGTTRGLHAVKLYHICKHKPLTPSLKAARKRLWQGDWPTMPLQRHYESLSVNGRSNRWSVFSFCKNGPSRVTVCVQLLVCPG